jgi:hypothetical protein
VGLINHGNKEWCPTKLERRVQERARRRAKRQLLRVSPNRFKKALQEYLEWESFSLWVRAIVDVERILPAQILETLQKRCPGFLQSERQSQRARTRQANLLPLHLLEWIHNHIFSDAERDGWLDALVYYTVRDPRSQRTWAYWEQCEDEWMRKRPRAYPSFEEWCRAVEKWKNPC